RILSPSRRRRRRRRRKRRRRKRKGGRLPSSPPSNVFLSLKRVEQASEYAIAEAFSFQEPRYPQGLCGPVTRLETVEQLQDHDEACKEARELLSSWMKSKLQLELMSDGEAEAGSVLPEDPSPATPKYERFDGESTTKPFLLEDTKGRQKFADPRITMELRHKQVKENRLRRQKALELQRQEKALKKSILSEAKLQIQEEDRRKALKAKMEGGGDPEGNGEAAKGNGRGRDKKKARRQQCRKYLLLCRRPLHLKKEEQEKEKQRKAQELLIKIHTNKQRCLQRHFSAWFKLVLEHRIQMGKARALADWKCQLKALRAWRNYTWTQKVQQETQSLTPIVTKVLSPSGKIQLSAEHNQRRLLRCCFLAWQRWSQAETEKRELQLKREETKRKMAQLLEAVSLGKSGPGWATGCRSKPASSFAARQGKAFHVALSIGIPGTSQSAFSAIQNKDPRTTPAYGSCFEHRYTFQQRLIEEQRQQLQKQQELILELQENQRLSRAKEEAAQAMAVTQGGVNLTGAVLSLKIEFVGSSFVKLPAIRGNRGDMAAERRDHPSHLPSLCPMEERAIQRAERRRKLEEAKQQREEEKLAQMKAEEEARQKREAEEKEAQQEKRREERRLQKQKELEKQRRLEREQELQKKARDHYESVLLRKLGMVPWKRLREQAKENLVVAERHHCLGLQRKCLMTWLQHTQSSLSEKVSRAEDFHSHTLLRQSFRSWLKDYMASLEERANTLRAACLKRKFFWAWFDLVMEEKDTLREKLTTATEHSDK
uniref:Coiled-coil domain containing 191 n=1 Tax=Anas platyrhynchos TaxID=8839 RepID=A0A8B9SQD1_ANAPL